MEKPLPENITISELRTLLKDLGYRDTGYPELLRRRILAALFEPLSAFPELSDNDINLLRKFALTLPADELFELCNKDNILFSICSDKGFWIEKILQEFKEDIDILETYPVEELKEIYSGAIYDSEENKIENIKDVNILSVSQFLRKNLKLRRSGIVPIIKRNKYTFYGFALDQSSGDITEFAGRKEEKDKDLLNAALRELNEESFGVFNITREMVESQNAEVLFNSLSCLFFVELKDKDFMDYVNKFNIKAKEYKKEKKKLENGLLFWVTEEQMRSLLSVPPRIYEKRSPVFFHYPTRNLLTYKFGNTNVCK